MSSANTVSLYRFERDPDKFCTSPFVNKLDALFVFSGLMDVKHERGTIFRAPHRKLPYIDLGGTLVPDSEICYNSCIEKGLVRCLDKKAGLSEKEIAISRSLRALVEKNLSEMLVYERWVENWYNTRDQYLADIPSLIRPPLAYIFAYRTVSAAMWSAGISRYSPTQRQNILEENVSAFSTLVPKSGYIMGKSIPTRVDATAFGFLASLSHSPELNPKMAVEIQKYPHVLDYFNRLLTEFWPQHKQLSEWISSKDVA